jgi:hypothetical protein
VLGCLWIITSLHPVTWLVFGGWTVLALLFYFTWGIRHSKLAHAASADPSAGTAAEPKERR